MCPPINFKLIFLLKCWQGFYTPEYCAALNVAIVTGAFADMLGRPLGVGKIRNTLKGLMAGITALARMLNKVYNISDHKDAISTIFFGMCSLKGH